MLMNKPIRSIIRRGVSYIFQDSADTAAALGSQKAGWFNSEAQQLAPDFKITQADTLVDVGCGSGGACVFAAKQGAEVVGIDVDPSAIAMLEQRMKAEVFGRRVAGILRRPATIVQSRPFKAVVSDCNPMPLPAGFATAVLAMEVLEHVDDPAVILGEMVRIGKPGARYFITVPDPSSETVLNQVAPPEVWQKPHHIRVFHAR